MYCKTVALVRSRISVQCRRNIYSTVPRVNTPWIFSSLQFLLDRVAQTVYRLAMAWPVRRSNPVGGEIFRTCPDRPWGTLSLLYNGYRVFPGVKERPERAADYSPPSVPWSRENRAIPLLPLGSFGLYRASVPVKGRTLPFYFQFLNILEQSMNKNA